MTPIEFPEQSLIIAENQKEYLPLPAYRYQGDPRGELVFCWKLSWRERLEVLLGGIIWHRVLTFRQPLQPQVVQTSKPEMPPHA